MTDHYEARCPSCGGSDEQGCYADCPKDELTRLRSDLEKAKEALKALKGSVHDALCESNGIFDNEWKTPSGAAIPEWPIGSFCEAIKGLDQQYTATVSILSQLENSK